MQLLSITMSIVHALQVDQLQGHVYGPHEGAHPVISNFGLTGMFRDYSVLKAFRISSSITYFSIST